MFNAISKRLSQQNRSSLSAESISNMSTGATIAELSKSADSGETSGQLADAQAVPRDLYYSQYEGCEIIPGKRYSKSADKITYMLHKSGDVTGKPVAFIIVTTDLFCGFGDVCHQRGQEKYTDLLRDIAIVSGEFAAKKYKMFEINLMESPDKHGIAEMRKKCI